MKIFFDNCTSPVLAHTLDGFVRHLHHRAHHIRELQELGLSGSSADIEWITALTSDSDDWILVTGDRRLLKNKAERYALRQARLKGFVLNPSYQKTPVHRCAAAIVLRWPAMEDQMRLVDGPALFELAFKGTTKFKPLPL